MAPSHSSEVTEKAQAVRFRHRIYITDLAAIQDKRYFSSRRLPDPDTSSKIPNESDF